MSNTVLQDTQKFPYFVTALDADGLPTQQLAAGSTFAVSSSDPTVASVVPDATPLPDPTTGAVTIASGFVVGQAKLGTNVQINAVETKADGTPGISGQLLVDVVAGAAASLAIAAGAPVAQ